MKIPGKYIIGLKTILMIIAFALLVILGVAFINLGETAARFSAEINTYKFANSVLTETIDKYTQENDQLKQVITVAQMEAENRDNYIESITAQVIYVPEYHEQIIINKVEVDKPVYINNEWREFESPASLMSWVKEHLANLWIVGNQIADCDDYASRLQVEAFKDGYLLSVQLVTDGMLYGKNISNFLEPHMGNLAIISNEIYFIEPQPEYFRLVYVCDRD